MKSMMKSAHLVACCVLLLTLSACQAGQVQEAVEEVAAEQGAVMKVPMTTDSEEAKARFVEALAAADVGRIEEARDLFAAAAEADPEFAIAHLGKAGTANSYQEFVTSLKRAGELAAGASEAEQAWIESVERGFANDEEGQLAAAQRVVELVPDSPRGWLQVAASYASLGNYAEERATAEKVIAMAPAFVPAYSQLANSYLFNEPRDFAKAEEYVEKIVELAPDEQNSHDLMGDVYRAQGDLEGAHAAYTRAAELAPDSGSPLQQRGHVNSFLGNWDEARADYDAAMELAQPQVRAAFGTWRALVSVHEGKPEAAVAEFEELMTEVDGMDLEDPLSPKINYLNNIVAIASHHGMYDVATGAIERNRMLRMERIEQTGAEEDRRNQEAAVVFGEGMVAAHRGDVETARAKAAEYMELVADDADPQKNEPAHAILGLAALKAGDAAEAVAQYEQANLDDPYAKYHLGLACEAAGDTERAAAIFADVARYNFNNAVYALIRADAIEKASM